ncbi:unnamed protein product, partial [marine sediment metagenome]
PLKAFSAWDKRNKNQPWIKAGNVRKKAISMKKEAIKKAKEKEEENWEKEKKMIQYNLLIKESRKEGAKKKDFKKALSLLEEAAELLPDQPEAKWGIATALHHGNKLQESINAYGKLIDEFPDNKRFKFEAGQVLLKNGDTKEGLESIKEAMEDTNEFDGFLARIGEIYLHAGMKKEALQAYNLYLKAFPADYGVWNLKGVCLNKMKRNGKAIKAFKMALSIKPDFKQAEKNLKMIKGK